MARGGDEPFMPFEIIINILKRLPVKSILRFQCVCKDWKDLFKTQSFIAEQVHHSVHENPSLLIHAYDYNYNRPTLRLLDQKMQTVEVLSVPSVDCFRYGWRIIGSCNGLLCVEGWASRLLCLWNPVLREVREIPPTKNRAFSVFGFGFSSNIDDYKIVRFSDPQLEEEEDLEYHVPIVEVYSLRTGSWKELEFGALQNIVMKPTNAVSADGTMAWIGVEEYAFPVLVSFDMVTEVFTSTPIPSSSVDPVFPTTLGVYQNKFAIFGHNSGSHSMDIWVMEEVATESGKRFSCTQEYSVDIFSYALDIFCIWRNKLVCCDKEREAGVVGKPKYFLKLFNLTSKEWKEFQYFSSAYDCCAGFSYAGSLLSLGNTQVQLPCSEI